jgi:hypothetical protein
MAKPLPTPKMFTKAEVSAMALFYRHVDGDALCTPRDVQTADMLDALVESLERASIDHSGWQPIDTAPKDGSYVMAYGPNNRFQIVAWEAGEYGLGWHDNNGEGLYKDLTHWQPLPLAPATREG